MNRYKALHSQNKCEEAIKCYDEALAINPKHAEALNYKGVSLHNLKKCEDAIKCYDEALTINPTYPDCLNNKVIIVY